MIGLTYGGHPDAALGWEPEAQARAIAAYRIDRAAQEAARADAVLAAVAMMRPGRRGPAKPAPAVGVGDPMVNAWLGIS